MNKSQVEKYIALLGAIQEDYKARLKPETTFFDDGSGTKKVKTGRMTVGYAYGLALVARITNAIGQLCQPSSIYIKHLESITEGVLNGYGLDLDTVVERLISLIEVLEADLRGGYVESIRELIHGEIFSDYLEMANHLLNEGYKDASAVIAGGTLEAHLRKICVKYGISIDETKGDGSVRTKKIETLNAELRKAEIYSLYDQKMVTAYLDLRNNAAHSKYDQYSDSQVSMFIEWLRDFINRIPG